MSQGTKLYDAVIAGYICVDLIPDLTGNDPSANVSAFFRPGKLIEIGGLSYTLGGVVANTGIAMKKYKKEVYLNGLIGKDFIGEIARQSLNKHHLGEGIDSTTDAGTAFGLVIAPPGIDRIFLESPGCSRLFDTTHIHFDKVAQSRVFHFGYPPLLRKFYLDNGKMLCDLFAFIQGMNVVTSLDFSLPDVDSESGRVDWPFIMQRVLPSVDIFVPSLEELLQIMAPDQYALIKASCGEEDMIDQIPVDTIRGLGRAIIALGVKILLVKAGHQGAYLFTGDVGPINGKRGFALSVEDWNDRECRCPAFEADPARVKNASGSGDAAAAAFLCAILDNEGPETALQYAVLAGRNNLYFHDMHHDHGDWAEMTEEIRSRTVTVR